MANEKETLEAVRNRIVARKKALETEISELDEMYRVLGQATQLDQRLAPGSKVERQEKSPARYNMNLSKQVDDYVASLPFKSPPEAISVKAMINTLKENHGIQGKDSSLYSYCHGLLKNKASKPGSSLRYEKGVGYYKARQEVRPVASNDSELVAAQ
jgi:hypothetical protein